MEIVLLPPRLQPKATLPSRAANMVKSRPIEVFAPGKNFVPRWRTITEPVLTNSLPQAFTPSLRPGESLPLAAQFVERLRAILRCFDLLNFEFRQLGSKSDFLFPGFFRALFKRDAFGTPEVARYLKT